MTADTGSAPAKQTSPGDSASATAGAARRSACCGRISPVPNVWGIELNGGFRGVRIARVESIACFLQYLITITENAESSRHRISISFLFGVVLVAVGGLALTALVMQL